MGFTWLRSHLASCLHSHKWLLYCRHWNRSYNSGMCHGEDAWSAHTHGMDYPVLHSYNHDPHWYEESIKHKNRMDWF